MKKKTFDEIVESILVEGGAAGHVSHLYENEDLTFADLKEVLQLAATGKISQVSEKLDGFNLMFTWDDDLRVARNTSDVKTGGMSADDLMSRFADRPNIQEAFISGFKVLRGAINSLSQQDKDTIFDEGRIWYSLELIYPALSNTINYDANSIVFHGWPVLQVVQGKVEAAPDTGVEVLASRIKQMEKSVNQTGWRINGPALVRLKDLSDGKTLDNALQRINDAMTSAGVEDTATLADYVHARSRQYVGSLKIPDNVRAPLAARLAGVKGSPNVTQLVKAAPAAADIIKDAVNHAEELKKNWIRPIELTISDFAVEILRGLESSLIADSKAEVDRLRAQVARAIKVIEASGHEGALATLKQQLEKLRSVEDIASPMEGVVFMFKGNAYKFTGSFAPAHQILSLFKYGRKDIKFDQSLLDKDV